MSTQIATTISPCRAQNLPSRRSTRATAPSLHLRAWAPTGREVVPQFGVRRAVRRSAERRGDHLLGLPLHLGEVLRAAERLGVDLVDVLGAGRAGGEPGGV